jgi:hypothetical protein
VPADFPSIQAAIEAAVDGDVIRVDPGVYVELIDFLGKSVRVESAAGPAETIIDGNRSGSVVTFDSGEDGGSVIVGFTIQNGRSTHIGGGIRIWRASPQILDNIIEDNQSCSGAGIHVQEGRFY